MANEGVQNTDRSSRRQAYGYGSSVDFVKTVLKAQFGNCEEFLEFERGYYYQIQELACVKNAYDELQSDVSKLKEEKRKLELQLVSEKSLRDQESRNALMEIEKTNVQCNAQIHSIKCEAESWKRKTEAACAEATWLKQQMRDVEMEKNLAAQKLTEAKSNLHDFERHRQSFESYYRRERELMRNTKKKLDELDQAREVLKRITDANQQQLDFVSVRLKDWNKDKQRYEQIIAKLQDELMKTKAELVQSNSKLQRAEMSKEKTDDFVVKLVKENEDLCNGLLILTNAVDNKSSEINKQLIENSTELRKEFESAVNRLHLNEKHFRPLSTSNSDSF